MTFVDTSYWIAAATECDAHHEEARRLSRTADALLVTTNHVRGETWTFMNRRHGHGPAVAFLDGCRGLYAYGPSSCSLRIREAFAFDGDFAAAGFTEFRA